MPAFTAGVSVGAFMEGASMVAASVEVSMEAEAGIAES